MRRVLLAGALLACSVTWALAQVPVIGPFLYSNITGQATTVLKAGPGTLHALTFNTPVATEVVTIFDSTTAAGTKIATITVPASPMPVTLFYDVTYGKGLVVLTATASSDITVSFR
jgi:hypothetical protein